MLLLASTSRKKRRPEALENPVVIVVVVVGLLESKVEYEILFSIVGASIYLLLHTVKKSQEMFHYFDEY